MKFSLATPVNETQRRFQKLCDLGGGRGGGPARSRVQELLHESGNKLNDLAYDEISSAMADFPDRDPWKVCFAVGLCWGHLARFEPTFIDAATRLLENWNSADLKVAARFHYERGPDPIVQSLQGGNVLFSTVRLPPDLPQNLGGYQRAQERWLSPILSRKGDRPRYIGSWNATAMFMVALFSDPSLAAQLTTPMVMLPPGGPIFNGLRILHQTHVLALPPSGSELDDDAFEPGAIYANNALFEDLLKGHEGWNLLTVHSGVYMLGTRFQNADSWFEKAVSA